jgi:phage terminase large subunit GpA-like protein
MMGARDFDLDDAEAEAIFDRVWREQCAPPPRLTVTEWAEANRVLSGKDSAEPGPYRVRRTPYAREPQDCLGARSDVEEVVLMWGAQTSKTTVGTNWIGYTIDHNPGPMMALWPTLSVAKRNSRQRLTPMFTSTPSLRKKISPQKSRDEANTMLLKDFSGGVLAIVGANAGSDLASMPMRDIFMDEVDRYPQDIPGEGRPGQLAEARQTSFSRRKRLKTSTPTIKDVSEIEAAYLASDQCRYYVQCPHCGEKQPLEFGADKPHGLRWDKNEKGLPIRASVRYVCRINGCEIKEHHKTQMLDGGVWVAENPLADGKVRGFHLSSLYSPLGWLGWYDIAKEWAAAMAASSKGDLSLLRVFINTRLAETYEDHGERADEHELRRRAADIPLRLVQPGHSVMTLFVDTQNDRLHLGLWAWGRGMRRQLVDREVIYGDPAIPEGENGSPWSKLTEYRKTAVMHLSGRAVPLLGTMIDSGGHHTQAVYAYARANQHERVMATKGQSQARKPIIGKPSDVDVNFRGQRIKRGVKLWPIGPDTAKAEFYGRLRVAQEGPGFVLLSKAMPADAFEQLTSERLVTRYVKGRQRQEWVLPSGKRNEDLDCAVGALACAHWAGMERWREADWAKWERRVQAEATDSKPAPQTPPATAPAETAQPEPKVSQEPAATPAPPKKKRGRIRGGFGIGNPWSRG